MASSIYFLPISVNAVPIAVNTDILSSDITFNPNEFSPGGSGLVRVWLAFVTATPNTDIEVSVTHDNTIGTPIFYKFNSDNNFNIKVNGLYRFDIPVKFGDSVNFQCNTVAITQVKFMRAECVVMGA